MSDTQDYIVYRVVGKEHSTSAYIFFVLHPHTHKHIVLKVLRKIEDERYDFSTIEKRQRCQIEAFDQNPKFTSDIYLGLAHIRETIEELERKKDTLEEIGVGPILDNPGKSEQSPVEKEYALLMHRLPEHCKLDNLLKTNSGYIKGETIPSYLQLLLERIYAIHTDDTIFPAFATESATDQWGSVEQLRKKLQMNLSWFKGALDRSPDLSDTYNWLKESLLPVLDIKKYQELFEQRLAGKHIKYCHGDLKANNIWVVPDEQPEACVKLLDCIDFKPLFCMIDTLSDIALLIVDIQAHTNNPDLANAVIDEYLRISQEEEEAARDLLAYYLVEKAFIGMVNSYIDNKNGELRMSYAKVVHQRMDELVRRIQNLR